MSCMCGRMLVAQPIVDSNLCWCSRLLDQCLQVHVQTWLIMMSKFAKSLPWSAFHTMLGYSLQCISEFTQLQLPSKSSNMLYHGLHVRTIMEAKCFSKLAWLQPACGAFSLVNFCLHVHLWVYLIMTSTQLYYKTCSITGPKYTSKYPQWASLGASLIAFQYCVQHGWQYVYTLMDWDR